MTSWPGPGYAEASPGPPVLVRRSFLAKAGEPRSSRIITSNAVHDALRKNLQLRRTLGAAGRHRPDAARRLHVLVRRCAGQIHGCDLFGRTIALAARLRGAAGAGSDHVEAARRVLASGADVAATAARDLVDDRGRGVLCRRRLSAARRRHHL